MCTASSLRRLLAAVAAALLVVALGAAPAHADGVNLLTNDFPQVHGELVPGLPTTPTCTTTVVTDKRFRNSAYPGEHPEPQDSPFTGDYVPTCGAGPWSRVVMTMSAYVEPGTQFDRIGDVMVGGVELLHFTTPEGTNGRTSWTIDRDVTEYASVLTQRQPTYFIIANQTDDTYTGIFYGTLRFTFYGTSAAAPADPGADQVLGVGLKYLGHDESVSKAITFPTNLTRLSADVFASGHDATGEEDWWDAAFACGAATQGPTREVGVLIDGRLVGAAPAFPTVYTGGYGPDFWRPIPGPRSLNMRPYRLDLNPYVGTLTDGQPHTVAAKVLDFDPGCVGYWPVALNLVASVNHLSTLPTTGALTSYQVPPLPTDDLLDTGALVTRSTNTHHLAAAGTIQPAGATGPTAFATVADLHNTATVAALDVVSDWTWDTTSTVVEAGRTTVDSSSSVYQLVRDGAHWGFVDNQDTSRTVDGATARTTQVRNSMQTGAGVVGVTGIVGGSQESWVFKSSDGVCADHELAAAVNQVLRDDVTTDCDAISPIGALAAPSVDPTPSPSVPEAPYVLLLPVLGLVGGVVLLRRRSR